MFHFRATFWIAVLVGPVGWSTFAIRAESADDDKNTPAASDCSRQRSDTPAGRLLDQLEQLNASEERFHDSWLGTLKEIADLGPNAVPALTAELDATTDNMMLRCCGFALRAIGDKRAVPALIRAVPKTLLPPGSDYGLRSEDPDLAKWAQQHELSESHSDGNGYGFGRPVREIFGALNKLTDHEINERQLYHVFLDGVESQRRMKQELFHREAKQWAEWWDGHAAKFTQDAAYLHVNLPNLVLEPPKAPAAATHYKTGQGHSNWILETVYDPKSKTVFYDLDTSRTARLPEKWRDMKSIDLVFDEIVAWAQREGFDLMGTQYTAPDGNYFYAIRSIAMQVWELDSGRWKMQSDDVTIEELKAEGSPADDTLLHFDKINQSLDPQTTASFLFITKEHTPGLLFIGIEVTDDSLKPGGISQGDNELQPTAFRKGRRFAYTEFEEVK